MLHILNSSNDYQKYNDEIRRKNRERREREDKIRKDNLREATHKLQSDRYIEKEEDRRMLD